TNIPYRTVLDNLKKLRDTGTIEHKKGNGRPSKITQNIARAVGQKVRRNSAILTRQLASVIQETQNISISHAAIWRHMKKKEYNSSIPRPTPMLTSQHIELRKAWALAHLQDNWARTIFTDETAFDLFRNK
ncbi:3750_t:CDS:1, partial [Paraglomus occultum]